MINKKNIFIDKILIAIILIFLNNNSVKSQIVLDSGDLPMTGDVQTTTIVDSSQSVTLLPGNAGPNVLWDFSNIFFCCIDQTNLRWIDPQTTINSAFFPLANIATKSHCWFYHDWQTHIVTEICDNRDYYIKDSTGLNYYGSDYPNPNILYNYRNIMPLLSYGQTKINNSRIVIQKSIDSVLVTHIKDTIKADAWGTVITPINTYNTIRFYTKETVWDSVYVNGNGFQIDFMPNNYYYKWFTKDLGFPVLQINKGIMETSKDYQIARAAVGKSNEVTVSQLLNTNIESFAFPNPSSNEIKILFKNNKISGNSTLYVFNMQGNEVFHKEYKSSEDLLISKKNINTGLFFYKVIFNEGTVSKGKFVLN